jgi:hypothetical protein
MHAGTRGCSATAACLPAGTAATLVYQLTSRLPCTAAIMHGDVLCIWVCNACLGSLYGVFAACIMANAFGTSCAAVTAA